MLINKIKVQIKNANMQIKASLQESNKNTKYV